MTLPAVDKEGSGGLVGPPEPEGLQRDPLQYD